MNRILAIIVLLMVSCEQPVKVIYQYYEPVELPTVEVEIMEIKAIKWYDNYIVSNQSVYGIDGSKIDQVIPETSEGVKTVFNDFFKKDNYVYFSIKDMLVGDKIPDSDPARYESLENITYYQQFNDELKVVSESNYPSIPESDRISMKHKPYKIEKTTYQKDKDSEIEDICRVYRGSLVEAYKSIDGGCKVDGGFWFSVPISYLTRYEGVYYWPLEGSKYRVLNVGRIW